MKQIDSRKFNCCKAGKLYVDNEYQYVFLLKEWLSAVMDDAASRAHQRTTLQMKHSKDPKTDEAEMSGELLFFLHNLWCVF